MPELAVGDPTPAAETWERELAPTTIFAEDDAGEIVGYAHYRVLEAMTHVRHLVTAPTARRMGVGQALLAEVASRARTAGCTTWCLNVMASNAPAQRLYEKVGFRRVYTSHPLRLAWSIVDAADTSSVRDTNVWPIAAEHVARVEQDTPLTPGLLARGLEDARIMLALEENGHIEGAAIFDPSFPGAYPFYVSRPVLAFVLLKALRPHARPTDDTLAVVLENNATVAEALIASGAVLRFEIVHMRAPLPATSCDVTTVTSDR